MRCCQVKVIQPVYWQSISTFIWNPGLQFLSQFSSSSLLFVYYLTTLFKSVLEIYSDLKKTFYFKLTCLSVDLLTELFKLSPLPFICEITLFSLKLTDFLKRAQVSYSALSALYVRLLNINITMLGFFQYTLLLKSYNCLRYKEPEVRERR